ncbi:MAG: HDOD domain-containing protein [Fimbriimonadaceae bacterium]|nr:HDOD domain-containing protein [Fimbriimonadaceae bacterium]
MANAAITLQDIVDKTSDLPTLPAAALKVMREVESPHSNASTIGNLLSVDQSLSVRVLRLANSAFYGLNRQVKDLNEAVVILGMKTVKNLAMVAATYPWMSRPVKGYNLGPRQMWCHAFGTAVGAQLVAKMSKACREDIAFTTGLLHDIGKVALSVWVENKIQAISYYATREGIPFDAAERKILGFDHCQVGGYLGEKWNLPEEVVLAIKHHHDPDSLMPDVPPVVDCVHVGNYLTMAMGFGLGGDGLLYGVSEESLARLGLSSAELDEIMDEFVGSYERYEELFGELTAA